MANGNQNIIGAGRESAHRAPRKTVLDVCCGGRMFWFDKKDPRTIYLDIRIETVVMKDCKARLGFQTMHIRPDIQSNFAALPFQTGVFDLVVFDPPHLTGSGDNCWLTKRYGVLRNNWRTMLSEGFSECFRVLRSNGTLIFKWNETDMPISDILRLTKVRPLFGHKSGRLNKTHWVSFLKEESPVLDEDNPALNTMEICHTAPNSGRDAIPLDIFEGVL